MCANVFIIVITHDNAIAPVHKKIPHWHCTVVEAVRWCRVSVYLYGAAATDDYRKTVPQIRAGEYEGLQEKVRPYTL